MFSIGEEVHWTSQAQGCSKRKDGVIVAYVAPGDRPSERDFPDLYKGAGVGYGRSVDSYVVRVGRKHYWPNVRNLQRSGPSEIDTLRKEMRQLAESRAELLEALKSILYFIEEGGIGFEITCERVAQTAIANATQQRKEPGA